VVHAVTTLLHALIAEVSVGRSENPCGALLKTQEGWCNVHYLNNTGAQVGSPYAGGTCFGGTPGDIWTAFSLGHHAQIA
jgi:hypothetical protein